MTDVISSVALAAAASLYGGGQPLDLIALADIQLELNVTEAVWLPKVITRCSVAAQNYCGLTFVPQRYQDLFFSTRQPWPRVAHDGADVLQLQNWPPYSPASPPSPALTAPPLAPQLSTVAGGALPASSAHVRISYVAPEGETAASMESFLPQPAATLLTVASPVADPLGVATGWNVYAGAAMAETLQNATPLPIGTSWTEPSSGLLAGAALPPYVLIVENFLNIPKPLAEGLEFLLDVKKGQLARLGLQYQRPRSWRASPTLALYNAGYAATPPDLQDAVIEFVKDKWFARQRDPMLRSQNVSGVMEQAFWSASAKGAEGDLPPNVIAKLDRFRAPVFA